MNPFTEWDELRWCMAACVCSVRTCQYDDKVMAGPKTRKKCRRLGNLMMIDLLELDKIIDTIFAMIYGENPITHAFWRENLKAVKATILQTEQWEKQVGAPQRHARDVVFGVEEEDVAKWRETKDARIEHKFFDSANETPFAWEELEKLGFASATDELLVVNEISFADKAPSVRLAARAEWLGLRHLVTGSQGRYMKQGRMHASVKAAMKEGQPHKIVETCITALQELRGTPAEEEV